MVTLILLALALAADAFAASLIQGVAARTDVRPVAWRCGLVFGAAQGLMPFLGWSVSQTAVVAIDAYDHWIAWAILSVLGAKLIKEGATRGPEDETPARAATGWMLFSLAIATSLDAAAAGLAFDALDASPWMTCMLIAAVTFAMCVAGVFIGAQLGPALGPRAEIIGGVALIGISVKILFDHGAISWAAVNLPR